MKTVEMGFLMKRFKLKHKLNTKMQIHVLFFLSVCTFNHGHVVFCFIITKFSALFRSVIYLSTPTLTGESVSGYDTEYNLNLD